EARVWRASLAFPAGQLSAVQGLSLEADSPGSAFVDATGVLRVAPLSPTSYGGVDVTVRGPSDARLALELTPADRPTQFSRIELTLAELVRDFHNRELDERGNRLIVRRAPGDALRFDFERDSLVFATEEVFAFQVTPHHAGIAPGTALRAVVQLHPARGTSSLWSYEQELTVAADGSLPAITPEALLMPKLEGAYDITVSLHPRTLTDKLRRPKPLLQRKVQVVVVDDRPAPLDPADWESVGEIDPTSETWWDRLALLPGFTRLPGYAPEPLGNNAATRFREGGIDCLRLEQGGWQAYPLPIAKKGVPHILEVEFPTGSPHTLGISIVEPDAAGSVGPIGLDSGVEVPVTLAPATSPLGVHRIVFWPRTDSPFVLLTNRGQSGPAMFGKLRVLSGPRTLPPASLTATSAGANSGTTAASIDERQLMAYFEKPLFNDNFMAGEALDEYTGRSLDDWQTCLDGARRFVEYLRYAGYNSAMVTVACDGSSIYPSRLLAPTGKYDNGMFFYTGQDPMRKDVLELLFRLFDREGMRLVPTVQFAAPLPALEAIKRQGAAAADGLELIGPEGRTWVASRGAQRGLAPYYNPLDDRVQQAMRNVVRELVERYDTHASFDGLAIQLEPDSYALLPGEPWGYDNRTLRRFTEESKSQLPDEAWRNFSARVDYLLGDGRSPWLDWRVENLTNFYRGLRDELVRRRPGAKLYLNASGMFSAASVRNQLLPKLPAQPAIAEALRLHGVDLSSFASDASIVAPRPSRQAPLDSPAGRL
ncbi:MAG: family 10 glycosylhydrolase, partial [Planctomycetales bacterium]|nr:family 10 glycosylhydrolase [Planctomycetales bacterium]